MRDLDQFTLLAFSAMEQKLDYGTVPTHKKILVPILLMLVSHVLVGNYQFHLNCPISLQHAQFVHLGISDWLEVLFKMKDVLNFAITMPGAPSVMMVLMKMMPMSFVVNLATQIKVYNIFDISLTFDV